MGLIERALQNLLENALKNTPPNGTIQVELRQHDSSSLTISVQNSIANLPEAVRMYFTGDSDTKERPPVAGLGLAIVDKILTMHNTRLRAEQPAPNLIRFIVELPVYIAT